MTNKEIFIQDHSTSSNEKSQDFQSRQMKKSQNEIIKCLNQDLQNLKLDIQNAQYQYQNISPKQTYTDDDFISEEKLNFIHNSSLKESLRKQGPTVNNNYNESTMEIQIQNLELQNEILNDKIRKYQIQQDLLQYDSKYRTQIYQTIKNQDQKIQVQVELLKAIDRIKRKIKQSVSEQNSSPKKQNLQIVQDKTSKQTPKKSKSTKKK